MTPVGKVLGFRAIAALGMLSIVGYLTADLQLDSRNPRVFEPVNVDHLTPGTSGGTVSRKGTEGIYIKSIIFDNRTQSSTFITDLAYIYTSTTSVCTFYKSDQVLTTTDGDWEEIFTFYVTYFPLMTYRSGYINCPTTLEILKESGADSVCVTLDVEEDVWDKLVTDDRAASRSVERFNLSRSIEKCFPTSKIVIPQARSQPSGFLGACLGVIRERPSMLPEWIDHMLYTINVSHVFVYVASNLTPPKTYNVLRGHKELTIIEWPFPLEISGHAEKFSKPRKYTDYDINTYSQNLAINDCFLRNMYSFDWLMLLDSDDFVQFPNGIEPFKAYLKQNSKNIAGFRIKWDEYNACCSTKRSWFRKVQTNIGVKPVAQPRFTRMMSKHRLEKALVDHVKHIVPKNISVVNHNRCRYATRKLKASKCTTKDSFMNVHY